MHTYQRYDQLKKPSWAPPAWVFGPVWSVLYIMIAISFGYVAMEGYTHLLPGGVIIPFVLNLIFNFSYTPLEFKLKSNFLASIDILLTLGTLIWAMIAIFPYDAWITYMQIPYLLWVAFATCLQLTITFLNRK